MTGARWDSAPAAADTRPHHADLSPARLALLVFIHAHTASTGQPPGMEDMVLSAGIKRQHTLESINRLARNGFLIVHKDPKVPSIKTYTLTDKGLINIGQEPREKQPSKAGTKHICATSTHRNLDPARDLGMGRVGLARTNPPLDGRTCATANS